MIRHRRFLNTLHPGWIDKAILKNRITRESSEAGRRVGRDNRWRHNAYSSADPEQHEER